jgi:hypothetical protein
LKDVWRTWARRIFSVVSVGVFCAGIGAAREVIAPASDELFPISFRSPRADALGGVHASLSDDFDTLFVNPAGFSSIEKQLSIAAFSIGINDFNTIFRLISSKTTELVPRAAEIKTRFRAGVDIGGPICIGWISSREKFGVGFGFMNRTFMNLWWNRDTAFDLTVNTGEEAAFILGFSFPIKSMPEAVVWTPAFSIKPFFRALFRSEVNLVEFRYILANLQEEKFQTQFGFGVDLAFNLTVYGDFMFSFVARNAIAPVFITRYETYSNFSEGMGAESSGNGFIRPTFDFSVSYRTRNTLLSEILSDIIFTLDWDGLTSLIGSEKRNTLLDLGVGVEVQALENIAFRIGLKQLLPCFGLGINLQYMQFNISLFGETFGNHIGDPSGMSFSGGLTFRY